jgi:WD40 repeat protein
MKVLNIITIASAFYLALTGIALADAVFPSGTVTAINNVSSSAVTSLDFDHLGNDVTIATITIDNNYENAFDLKLAFTNDGVFKRVAAAGGDGTSATGIGTQIPITQFTLQPNAGTLGTGLSSPAGTFSLTPDAGGAYYIWDTHHTQTTATVGYQVEVQADWVADTGLLQGTYRETLTATLTVGDGL